MSKDWIGGNKGFYTTNHRKKEEEVEENDFYATHPDSVKLFLKAAKETNLTLPNNIWENACGDGAISKVLKDNGYTVFSTDLVDRGYGEESGLDFLTNKKYDNKFDCIITNPPYSKAREFVERSIEAVKDNGLVVMFMKLTFLESAKRYSLFKQYPPKYVYVHVDRQGCGKGGGTFKNSGAAAYCWYVWQKGCTSEPIIRWIK